MQVSGASGLSTTNALEQLVKVYPNPATEHVVIESPQRLSQVRLTDLTGKVVAVYSGVGEKFKIEIQKLRHEN